ncbi:MAG: hypothetical protein BMS9Abin17_1213 [Acidimicrobiia bacterium]|nr:MAG: hypothetical protein BMS9Abin17_1213 [Acidimicrobiia bacterium]
MLPIAALADVLASPGSYGPGSSPDSGRGACSPHPVDRYVDSFTGWALSLIGVQIRGSHTDTS